jgi:hypothetical protein
MSNFKLEKEMTPIVRKWLEDQGYIVRPEMVTVNNCDLVGCKFDMDNVRLRVKQRQKTPLSSAALSVIERDPDTRRPEWMPLASHIIAVELKLSRIREVVDQALWHTYHAHQSYIAMPLKNAERAMEKEKVGRVGVLGVTPQGVQLLHRAAENNIRGSYSDRIAEVFWRYHRNELKL